MRVCFSRIRFAENGNPVSNEQSDELDLPVSVLFENAVSIEQARNAAEVVFGFEILKANIDTDGYAKRPPGVFPPVPIDVTYNLL